MHIYPPPPFQKNNNKKLIKHLLDHQYNICLPQMSKKMFETFILLETQRPFVENKMDILTLLIKVSPF